ncbi:TetR family transcriptional regulator C-terminal domain-containing protein [Streptomyces sp. ISL-10]|uniref:TetR family transcriptional regulator C-terminal domain-containing protein n=1 Tax=Streptomyces sp. ISL-10 TaxID=2819172 RepID=UPI0027E50A55|nr:TetR family transcriptional regulator C-terminal domain-containing protein [Streptomyces sp. ISL-10]
MRAQFASQELGIDAWTASASASRTRAAGRIPRPWDQQWKLALIEVLAEGAAAGEFPCEDPAAAAWRLTAFLDGQAVQMTSYAGSLSRAPMLQWTDEALARERGIDQAALTATAR